MTNNPTPAPFPLYYFISIHHPHQSINVLMRFLFRIILIKLIISLCCNINVNNYRYFELGSIYIDFSRHLGMNPLICDCNLRWLADYLHKNPIETSGARCESPKRMHGRRIKTLREEKFKCKYL